METFNADFAPMMTVGASDDRLKKMICISPSSFNNSQSHPAPENSSAGRAVGENNSVSSLSCSGSNSALCNTQAKTEIEDQWNEIQSLVHCNWFSLAEITAHDRGFSYEQSRSLQLIRTKQEFFHEGFDEYYFSNALPLIAGNAACALSYVCCGRRKPGQRGEMPCDRWSLCSKCARSRSNNALARYSQSFNKGQFYFVTVSFKGGISFEGGNINRSLDFWDVINSAIRNLFRQDEIKGAYWVDELALLQFSPVRVLPHAHAIIDADRFTDEQAVELEQCLYTAAATLGHELELEPSIDVKVLKTDQEFVDRLQYCTKPISIKNRYQSAFSQLERWEVPELNKELQNFIEEYLGITRGFTRIHQCGTMMPQRRDFIGLKGHDLKDARKHMFQRKMDREDAPQCATAFLKD